MSTFAKIFRQHLVSQAVLIAVVAVLCAFGIGLTIRTIETLCEFDARAVAIEWSTALNQQEGLVDRVLSENLTPEDEAFMTAMAEVSTVFDYEIYNIDGDALTTEPSGITRHTRGYAAAFAGLNHSQDVDSHFWHGDGAGNRPDYYVDVHVPLNRDGVPVALIDVYVDVTENVAGYWRMGIRVMVVFGALILITIGHAVLTAWLLRRQHETAQRIADLAVRDPLTGVANRTYFSTAIQEAFEAARADPGGKAIALHFIDLDRFKSVNDSLGHNVGDMLLREVASSINHCVGADDIIARLGGDEFAVLQRGIANAQAANRCAEAIVARIASIRHLGGVPVRVSVSVGTALGSQAGDAGELQRFADASLYEAKHRGRDQNVPFEPGMDEGLKQQNLLRLYLRHAMENAGFLLHYQPLHDARTGALRSFEALLRLPDDNGGFIPPSRFIPVAEEMSMTHELGAWVLKEATRAAVSWPSHLSVAVNLSPQQFQSDVVGVVREALEQSGLEPHRLEIEITENLFISELDEVELRLRELKALGVRIVMDDFGTGYSSLQHLWKFPFDKLKVDRSCFQALGESESVPEILRTIRAMSAAMKLSVTAEGIETEAQRDFALAAGYDELQGFLYSRALPPDSIADYIVYSALAARPALAGAEVVSLDAAASPRAITAPAPAMDEDAPPRIAHRR